jgi:hypothetical protein
MPADACETAERASRSRSNFLFDFLSNCRSDFQCCCSCCRSFQHRQQQQQQQQCLLPPALQPQVLQMLPAGLPAGLPALLLLQRDSSLLASSPLAADLVARAAAACG